VHHLTFPVQASEDTDLGRLGNAGVLSGKKAPTAVLDPNAISLRLSLDPCQANRKNSPNDDH
jgi:hypothetical protein